MTSEQEDESGSDAVALLIRAGGTRAEPPAGARDAVFPVVEAVWRAGVTRRQRRRVLGWAAAAAASLAVAATALLQLRLPAALPETVAHVDRIAGAVETRPPGAGAWIPLTAAMGQALQAGTGLRTGEDGHAGLWLGDGVSLRIASLTTVELDGATRVQVLRGAVYADTGPGAHARSLELVTPAGVATDTGTQFEVQYEDGAMRVRVREGRVALRHGAGQLVANAGEQLAVAAGAGVARSTITPTDPDWQWVQSLAPAPTVDGQPVTALLQWVARETGLKLRYADGAAEQLAAATILHGRVGHVAPLDSLELMLATTDLAYSTHEDTIEIRTQ